MQKGAPFITEEELARRRAEKRRLRRASHDGRAGRSPIVSFLRTLVVVIGVGMGFAVLTWLLWQVGVLEREKAWQVGLFVLLTLLGALIKQWRSIRRGFGHAKRVARGRRRRRKRQAAS